MNGLGPGCNFVGSFLKMNARSWPVVETHALLDGLPGSSAFGQVTELGSLELSGAVNDPEETLDFP